MPVVSNIATSHGVSVIALLIVAWFDFRYPTYEQLRLQGARLGRGWRSGPLAINSDFGDISPM